RCAKSHIAGIVIHATLHQPTSIVFHCQRSARRRLRHPVMRTDEHDDRQPGDSFTARPARKRRTAAMSSTAPFSRIPQPMIGMNWEPAPSDYTSIPAPAKYGDTDFANDDFAALWNVDGSGIGRSDLTVIKNMSCNTIKLYN